MPTHHHPTLLLLHYANQQTASPTEAADQFTSMCDARTALTLNLGTSTNDIDPTTGHNISRRGYETVRESWISLIANTGFNAAYPQTAPNKALAYWSERRPDLTAGDDWLAAGLAAHREAYQGVELGCGRQSCDERDGRPEA